MQYNYIRDIWQPRWHDRKVLIAKHKVVSNVTTHVIQFSKAPTLPHEYHIPTAQLSKYPVETNGTVPCYCVPLNDFEVVRHD